METLVAVHTPAPKSLDDEKLRRTLSVAWGLAVGDIRYVPKGSGGYHWVAEAEDQCRYFLTVDDLDTKPWIADNQDRVFDGLAAAYEAAWALGHQGELSFVVGPLRSRVSSIINRLSGQYSLAVFPFVEGKSGNWGDPLDPMVCDDLIRKLALMHGTVPASDLRLVRRPLTVPERPLLTAALDDLDQRWQGGPLSEPARRALADHALDVKNWLAKLDALADRLQDLGDKAVVTHGEPHPGNLIDTDVGSRLIDWDTVALARPERDLWMLHDGSPGGLALYEELTGTRLVDTAMSFYQLAWTLSDIASLANMFRRPHQDSQWIRQKWAALQHLLRGEPSAPYTTR
jgi:spectinomycin phosphotransferase